MSEILRTEHLCFSYEADDEKSESTLDDISISVKKGEFVAVLGQTRGKASV